MPPRGSCRRLRQWRHPDEFAVQTEGEQQAMDGLTEPTTTPPASAPDRRRDVVNVLFRFQSYFGLIIVFLLAIVISPVRNDANLFLKPNNLLNIVLYASETGVLAVGMTLVILVAGIDLSVGSVMALIGVGAGALLMQDKVVT